MPIWHDCADVEALPANMILSFAAVIGGLALLTVGADRFVDGASATARNFGVPPLLIGLIVVGFATSAPEMLVSAVAALDGNPDVGIGNAIGSNIANIGLVIGMTALLMPLTVASTVLRREFPLMFAALALAVGLMWDGSFSLADGLVLTAGLVAMIGTLVWLGLRAPPDDPMVEEALSETNTTLSPRAAATWLVVGLLLLLGGSRLLVDGAVDIARYFGVSDVVIGLTIVAVGTSLPELAASIMGALKGEPDIALGNVIGSNMFNALGVLAMPALIAPGVIEPLVLRRDVPCMLGLSVVLYIMAGALLRPGRISRFEGALLLLAFVAYQGLLFLRF